MSFLTARVLVSTLRGGLGTLVLLSDGLPRHIVSGLEDTAAAIDSGRIETTMPGQPTVRLHIGASVTERAVRVVPEGYGAHITTARTATIRTFKRRPGCICMTRSDAIDHVRQKRARHPQRIAGTSQDDGQQRSGERIGPWSTGRAGRALSWSSSCVSPWRGCPGSAGRRDGTEAGQAGLR